MRLTYYVMVLEGEIEGASVVNPHVEKLITRELRHA